MSMRGRTADRVVLAGIAALTLLLGARLAPTPLLVGEWLDDTIYLATAKSLADGQGYRHPYLPDAPYQTKYPILWPAVLALVWKIQPQFPDNLRVVVGLNVALTGVGVAMAYLAMRRAWGVAWWLAAGGALLTLLSNVWLTLMATGMSEPLYLTLAATGLWLAALRPTTRRTGWVADTGAAFASAATALVRSAGLANIAAAVVGAALRRRWRQGVIAAACGVLAWGGWKAWESRAAEANAATPIAAHLRYDLGYAQFAPGSPSVAARRAWFNSADLLISLVEHVAGLPPGLTVAELQRGGGSVVVLYAAAIVIAALMVGGGVYWWRTTAADIHLFVLATLAIISVWPWPLSRSLAPLLPFLYTFLLTAICAVLAAVARLISGASAVPTADAPTERSPLGAALHPGVVIAVALLALPGAARAWSGYGLELRERAHRRQEIADLIRRAAPAGARIAAETPALIHLYTGAIVVPPVPPLWSEDLHAPPDAAWQLALRVPTKGLLAARDAGYGPALPEYWRNVGVTHVLVEREETRFGVAVRALSARTPGLFRTVGETTSSQLLQIARPLP